MKLVLLLLTVTFLQVSATGFAQQVTLNKKNASLEKIFEDIYKQTGYQFVYAYGLIKNANKVSINAKSEPLEKVLETCFKDQPFTYAMMGNAIILKKKEKVNASQVQALAPIEVSGKVTDSLGNPLIGVTIKAKEGGTGTVTDANGNYSITVPDDAVLVVSYVGYQTKEIMVNGRGNIDVVLSSSVSELNQLVVVGYGTQKKKDLTGSISSVTSEDLQKVSSNSFTSAIQGKVPGVFISQTSGAPGSAASVRIRGVGTTGGNQPLYVIDGIPISSGSMGVPGSSYSIDALSIINPNDIKSITILKDAASTAIYGARGANGVILVTTKRGEEGHINVNFNARTEFSQIWRKPEFLNAQEFAKMANELYINSGLTPNPEWANPASLGKGTDMIGLIFRNAPLQNYYLSVSGGMEKLNARLSLGYSNKEGTIIETSYKRYTGRATVDFKANTKLHFGGSMAFAATQSKGLNTDAMQGGIINLAQQFFPTLDPDSAFYGSALYYTKDGDNPILKAKTIDNKLYNFRIYGNVFGEYEIITGLKFKTNIGIDANFNRTSTWQGKIHRGFYSHPQATLHENFNHSLIWDIENTLSYSKNFGPNAIVVVLGQSGRESKNNWLSATGRNYLNETLRVINASDVSLRSANGSAGNSTIASYFGRLNYSFKDKYLISTSLRRDGSSNFGPNNKWGYFPAVSAGWRLSKEAFMRPIEDVIDNLKIRASWGKVGNDAIPAFGYLSTVRIGTNSDNYALGYDQDIVTGATLLKPGNPDLKWETVEQMDIGLDASLFNEKIYLTADYYIKNTLGMLVRLPVSLESGFQNAPIVNGGKVQNKGLELLLGYRGNFGSFQFNVSGNISTLKNVVKSLGVGQPIVGGGGIPNLSAMTYTEVGHPIGYFRGYIVDGVYQTDAKVNKTLQPNAVAGDFIYRDINRDGKLTDADKVYLGDPWPDITYGINIGCIYKGFSLSILLQGVSGNQIFAANKASNYQLKYFNGNGLVNGVKDVLNHWTPGSGVNDQPGLKFTDGNGNYSNPSSFFVENGAYMRVRNLLLSYNISPKIIDKINTFKSISIYVSAKNLFTFTQYSGFDPEIGSMDPLNAGIDTGIYPQPRTFIAGININF